MKQEDTLKEYNRLSKVIAKGEASLKNKEDHKFLYLKLKLNMLYESLTKAKDLQKKLNEINALTLKIECHAQKQRVLFKKRYRRNGSATSIYKHGISVTMVLFQLNTYGMGLFASLLFLNLGFQLNCTETKMPLKG
ncbi:MAG: hypothetical protein HC896_00420 [Bacteroidales bacterium]|nr:hypothetical protein [Bacteroidales bacterium]